MEAGMVNLVVAIAILAGVNITLGSLDALFVKEFDFRKFYIGLVKASTIVCCVFATYYAGSLVPEVLIMPIGDVEVNLMTALYVSGVGIFTLYGKQVVDKLVALLTKKK